MSVSRFASRCSLAAALTLAAAAPALAAPVTYVLDNSHSAVSFTYRHLGLSNQTSRFNQVSGTIVLDTEAKTGKVDITVDTGSVNTGGDTFNGHLKSADFLDTAAYPKATFVSDKVVFEGQQPVAIEGKLTIKGVSHDVTVKIDDVVLAPHPMLKKPTLGAEGSVSLAPTTYNIGKLAAVTGDAVSIRVVLEAIAAE